MWPDKYCPARVLRLCCFQPVWFACILKALSVSTGCFVSVVPSAHKLLHWQWGAVQMQIFARYRYCYDSGSTTPRKIHALGADARLRRSRCQSKNLEMSSLFRNVPFLDRKSTRLNSSHLVISYAVFCLK